VEVAKDHPGGDKYNTTYIDWRHRYSCVINYQFQSILALKGLKIRILRPFFKEPL